LLCLEGAGGLDASEGGLARSLRRLEELEFDLEFVLAHILEWDAEPLHSLNFFDGQRDHLVLHRKVLLRQSRR
jgi:hypothetical protein